MEYTAKQHTFAICAYKRSSYLEECIRSLRKQEVKSNIIIVTATPNAYIQALADKYKIPIYMNKGETGIANDWNYACQMAKTSLVTITHQDDIYMPKYLLEILKNINISEKPLIAFSNYGEIKANRFIKNNRLLNIKRIMLFPLRIKRLQKNVFTRRRILSLGSPICCPSVTFVKDNLQKSIFKVGYRSDVDWQAWEKISREKGSFVYCKELLMYHRIHSESETTKIIIDGQRTKEDFEMFCCFWPKCFAKIIIWFYKKSQESNMEGEI